VLYVAGALIGALLTNAQGHSPLLGALGGVILIHFLIVPSSRRSHADHV
jgi:hypothetical protein